MSRGKFGGYRGDSWWSGEVQGKVEAKKVAYVNWVECKDEKEQGMNKEIYKAARTNAKLVVTETITTFERHYAALGDKGRDEKLYRLMNTRKRKARDLD